VWFLESLDAVHRALQGSSDLGAALNGALAVLVDVFACDRAWLLEAHGETWMPVMERTRPEYPGGLELGVKLPLTAGTARRHRRVLESESAVQLNAEEVSSVVAPEGVAPPRAILAMAIYPKVGAPWILGLHQCSCERTWNGEEERLFAQIGHRLADALTSLLAYRDVLESEQKFAQAQRVARLGYWERDVRTFEVEYSEETYRIFGLSRDLHALEPTRLAERLHPDDRHIMLEAYERAIAGGPRYDVDYRVLLPDGVVRYVHSEADVSLDADGRPVRMFGTMQDITERKELAREQEALRRVATLVARATSPEGILASVAEEAGRLLDVDLTALARYDAGMETILAGWSSTGAFEGLGGTNRIGGNNLSTIVYETGRPARMDNYDHATGDVAALTRAWGVRASVGVPIIVGGEIRGVMYAASTSARPLRPDTERRLSSFTELLATAYANAEAREALRRVADEQAALRRVATLVARGVAPHRLLAAVAEEAVNVLPGAEISIIGRYTTDHRIEFVGGWGRAGTPPGIGAHMRLGGHNVSTLVHDTGEPARVDHLEDDAAAVTAIARRSRARSSAGAPIKVEGGLWGVITVASSDQDGLPLGIEHRVAAFTELVATAISNAEAREALSRVAEEQAALRRVATLVAQGEPPHRIFAAVAAEVGELVREADVTLVGRYDHAGSIEFVGEWSSEGTLGFVGERVALGDENAATAVLERDALDVLSDEGASATVLASYGVRASAGTPILVGGRLWGVMTVGSRRPDGLPAGVELRLADFSELVATAISNAEGRAQLVTARRRVIEATDAARAKPARDIHDGAQQQFLTALIDLQLAQQKRSSDPGRSRELVDLAAGQVETGVETLRELAAGLHPAILTDLGLKVALEARAARMPMPLSVTVDDLDLPVTFEASVYFFCSEALTNIVKHAKASAASVRVQAVDGQLTVEVHDDGVGGAEIGSGGTGLIGLHDRIGALEGSLSVSSPPGGAGTTLVARIPLPG
jgi:PAS domain S-box-containing protein